jgi:hypothetical protein
VCRPRRGRPRGRSTAQTGIRKERTRAAASMGRTQCLLPDRGFRRAVSPSVHPPRREDRRSGGSARALGDGHVTAGGCRPMFSKPLAHPSTLDRRPPAAHFDSGHRPTWRSSGARPGSHLQSPRTLTRTVIRQALFAPKWPEPFSLERGLNSVLCLLQTGITFQVRGFTGARNREGDPLGRPRSELLCGSIASAHTSQRGRPSGSARGPHPSGTTGTAQPWRHGPP